MPLAAAAAESAGEQADSAAYLQLVRWISLCSKASGSGPKVGREPMMYPWMSAFIAFVAKELASAAAVEEGSEETLKLVSFGNSTLSPMTATTTAESISASFWVLVTPAAPQTPLRRTKTRDMDVSTKDGRKTFETLLTNLSMCESWRLGYGPTIN
ncbi:hypothetical protein IWW43_000775 [Coemansia sp. RSA 1935]|nr:hypothetical protein IWW43_000775 [Coemansia sp. RSA 1935]